ETTSAVPSMLACLVGLGIVRATIFRNADPLDKKRWSRYWHGHLVGYFVAYIPLFIAVLASILEGGWSSEGIFAVNLLVYGVASLIGLWTGFLNVRRTDDKDKIALANEFRVSRSTQGRGYSEAIAAIEASRVPATPSGSGSEAPKLTRLQIDCPS